MKEYDIFIPLYHNDGTPVDPARFQDLQSRLLEQFEGLTYFPQPNQGFWKFGEMTYRDEIVIYRVISQDAHGAGLSGWSQGAIEARVPAGRDPDHRTRSGFAVKSDRNSG